MKLMMTSLAVLTLTAPLLFAEPGSARLRMNAVSGEVLVYPPDAPPFAVRGPLLLGAVELAPGTVVEMNAGTASFESDLHARIAARKGAMFRFSLADPEGRRGLRVELFTKTAPLALEVGGTKLDVTDGGRVAVYEAGYMEVEGGGVTLAEGSSLKAGEGMTWSFPGTPGTMSPGDSLSLNVPFTRYFSAPSQTVARITPVMDDSAALARVEPEMTQPPAADALLVGGPAAEDRTLRDAVAARAPVRLMDIPFQAPQYAAIQAAPSVNSWPFTRTQSLGGAIALCLGLLLALEIAGRKPVAS